MRQCHSNVYGKLIPTSNNSDTKLQVLEMYSIIILSHIAVYCMTTVRLRVDSLFSPLVVVACDVLIKGVKYVCFAQ